MFLRDLPTPGVSARAEHGQSSGTLQVTSEPPQYDLF